MAQGVIKKLCEEYGINDIEVESGGLAVGYPEPASDNAIAALSEIGVDISGHRSNGVPVPKLHEADKIYVMTQGHKTAIVDVFPELGERISILNISDPYGMELERYRECRDEIERYFVDNLFSELLQRPQDEGE